MSGITLSEERRQWIEKHQFADTADDSPEWHHCPECDHSVGPILGGPVGEHKGWCSVPRLIKR